MSRSGRRNGHAGEAGPFVDARTGFRGWRFRVGAGRGIPTPAVMDGRVYFGGGFGSHEVYALDGHSGHLLCQLRTRDHGPTAVVGLGPRVVSPQTRRVWSIASADVEPIPAPAAGSSSVRGASR